jgi:hypothetical protein
VCITSLTGVGAFLWKSSSPPAETGEGDRFDRCWSGSARVSLSTAFLSSFWWLLVPRTNSNPLATWFWPTWVAKLETCFDCHVRLVGVAISFEKNFYLPFTPPSLVCSSVLHTIRQGATGRH